MSFSFNSATSVPQTEDGPQIAKKEVNKLDEFLWRNTKIGMAIIAILIVVLLLAKLFLF